MDIVTLGAALNGSAEYVNSHFKGGSNIQIVDNPDGTQTINASGEVSAEDTVARADIAAIKDGESLDSFADVETALGSKQDTISDLSTIRSGAALGATAVQPETGKGLSTNDYTTTEKTKLAGIAEGAEVNVQANWTQTTSTADDYIKNKPTLGTAAALDVAASGNASTSQVVKGNDTRLTDARNAADVSSWAKAANKPSYNGSEIALTGYAEAQSKASVAATDTANAAIGKLEYRVETNENNISLLEELNGAKNYLKIQQNITVDGSGITAVKNSDNSITLNGTATSTCYVNIATSSGTRLTLPAGTYVMYCPQANTDNVQMYDNSTWNAKSNNSKTFDGNTATSVIIRISSGQSFSNTVVYPMIVTKSTFDSGLLDYQPYALSNVELTAKEQVNENNILSEQAKTTGMTEGGSNYITINGIRFYVSSTTPTGTIPVGSIGVGF